MSNQRSVMTEFRFLDQKRLAEGLTAEEASRYAQLRDLVGPETAGPARSGFDVNAAAAKLRESLLPAGLRARPAEAAPPPPPAPEPEPAPPAEALALEQAWAEAPFAELEAEPTDPLFDPGSLAQEVRPQAWNPEAPGYDPNAPYDEAAWIAAGYDPNATYDWSAHGYGPDGQPLAAADAAPAPVEGAAEAAPGAPAWDAAAGVPPTGGAEWEAVPAPLEVAEAAPELGLVDAAAELVAAPLEGEPIEAAPEAWGAVEAEAPLAPAAPVGAEQPWDGTVEVGEAEPPPAGVEQDWGAPAAEPEALSLGEVEAEAAPAAPTPAPAGEEELPFDPNAPFDHAKWFGRPAVEGAAAAPAVDAAPEPLLEPELEVDLGAEPAAPAFGEYDEAGAPLPLADAALDLGAIDAPAAAGLETPQPDPTDPTAPAIAEWPALEGAPIEAAPAEGDAAAWLGDAAPATHLPAPTGAPFGEYDEAAAPLAGAPVAGGGLEAMLPFDPAAASAIEPGAMPEGYEAGGPVLDPATLPPADGSYDDTAAFAADQMYGGPEGDSLPGGAPLELAAGMPDWQPEAALEQGFELASDGSFGHADLPPGARTPAWGTAVAAPAEGWESAPALDLAGPFDAPVAEAAAPADAPLEELPTIDGAELLEELPPEGSPAEAMPAASPFDGAFEAAGALEPAAPAPALTDPLATPFPEPAEASPLAPDLGAGPAAGYDPFAAAEPLAEPEPPTAPFAAADPFLEPGPAAEAAPAYPAPAPQVAAHLEPEPAVSYEPAPEELPPEIAAAYAAPAGGGDTFELPPAVADGLFDAAPEPEPLEAEPLPPPPPSVSVAGSHRVVLHTVDGQVKRGLLVDALLDAPELPLQAAGAGAPELLPTEGIKAIFFMLAPGEKAPAPEGKKVRVTFRDGRQVAGFSPDYQEGLSGFFMIPADTRTNTGRIWVYQAAVKAVAVS